MCQTVFFARIFKRYAFHIKMVFSYVRLILKGPGVSFFRGELLEGRMGKGLTKN